MGKTSKGKKHIEWTWIEDNSALDRAVKEWKKFPDLAVDTEFIRETSYFPDLCLIQVATMDHVWLIDTLSIDPETADSFREILLDPKVLKIMHAAYADQEAIYWAFGIVATPVFDTSVGAALAGIGDQVGLGKLARELVGVDLPKGQARAKWKDRPLPEHLGEYAAGDVAYLVDMSRRLLDKLSKLGREDWAIEAGQILVEDIDPEPRDFAIEMVNGLDLDAAASGRFIAMVIWREEAARNENIPRLWVLRQDVLLSLAKVNPKNQEQLRSFRGMTKYQLNKWSDDILEALHNAEPFKRSARRERMDSDKLAGYTDFLKSWLNWIARKLEISPRYLMTKDQILMLLCNADQSEAEWVKRGILSENSVKLIGKELRECLEGKRAMVIQNGEPCFIELP